MCNRNRRTQPPPRLEENHYLQYFAPCKQRIPRIVALHCCRCCNPFLLSKRIVRGKWLRTQACPKSHARRESWKPQRCVPITHRIVQLSAQRDSVRENKLDLRLLVATHAPRSGAPVSQELQSALLVSHTILASSPRRVILTGADGVGNKLGNARANSQCDARASQGALQRLQTHSTYLN